MKASYFLRAAVLSSAFLLALGCQKENIFTSGQGAGNTSELKAEAKAKQETRAYRDSFVIQLGFKPDIKGGWKPSDPDAPTWYPGTGTGHATHMGNAGVYFNTHTLRVAGTVMVFHAPVGLFFPNEVKPFGINPTDNISMVVYDNKGNSIWFRITEQGLLTWHLDATNIAMEGPVLIVGGTGKFAGATGATTFHGQFDQASLNTQTMIFESTSIWQKGWIRY